jgi:large subunit ribosomal protein L25
MADLVLRAEPRSVVGKKVNRLRREGRIPGVVYGPVVEGTIQVSVDRREFDKFYNRAGHSTLFTLEWDGATQPVFIREVQLEPVRHDPLHIDFFAPNLTKELIASVPVVLHHPNGNAEGILNHVHTEIQLRGLPTAMPHQIDADISGLLVVGDALRVADLALPEGIAAVTHEGDVIVSLVAQYVEPVEEVEEEEVEAEEGAEEAAAEGEAPAAEAETESAEGESE